MLTLNTMKIAPKRVPPADGVRSLEDLARAHALEECLAAMDRGQTDLDELCDRYPEAQDDIRPLLEMAKQLRRQVGSSVPLSLEFREGLRRLLSKRRAV
jgi:hypothetical protein